jgi:RNA:NAD 2'-phosphotransferase (TPT1/KptA family)
VGRRHGDEVVVFAVDVDGLRADGIAVDRRSPVVFTCPRVPPEYLEIHGAPED